jgi:LuxR family maltose regulon positive regulatory protein
MAHPPVGTVVSVRAAEAAESSAADGASAWAPGPVSSTIDTAKIEVPTERNALVRRDRLLARLQATTGVRVIAVIGTAGSGKTTLLSQLARARDGEVAWVTVDDTDNDAKQLLRCVAESIARSGPLDPSISASLASPETAALRVLARLTNSLRNEGRTVTVIIDGVQVITNQHALDVVTTLVERVPPGSVVVLAGRTEPGLPIARWRATGALVEVDTQDLALDVSEAERVVVQAGARMRRAEVEAIVEATEGWAAGVYLAALSRRAHGRSAGAPRLGDDAFVTAYVESELLADLGEEDLLFLVRTSILDELSGPLCDAVSGLTDSARRLEDLERRNMLIFPIDPDRRRFRYHTLLRDALRRRLERADPEGTRDLHRAASAWLEGNGDIQGAVEHALRADDVATATRLIDGSFLQLHRAGGDGALGRWLRRVGDEAIAGDERLTFVAAWLAVMQGDADRAGQWTALNEVRAAKSDADGEPAAAERALLRAVQCGHGLEQMRTDIDDALRLQAADDPWRPDAVYHAGLALLLAGEVDAARVRFRQVDAMESAQGTGALHMAWAELALDAMSHRGWSEAEELVRRHRSSTRASGVEDYQTSLLGLIADARLNIRRSDIQRARDLLVRAQLVRPKLTKAMPHWAVRCLVELARTQLLTADSKGAAASVRQAEEILADRPGLGLLATDVAELRERLDLATASVASAGSLTPAEVRLLTLLQTHLTFKEMASRLGISPNTAKTESMSLYAKLAVTSRSEAVERAVVLGLLESMLPPVPPPLLTRTRRCPEGPRQRLL